MPRTIPNMNRVVELVRSGAIGRVREVHSWVASGRGMPDIPTDKPPVPAGLDYDLWVGPAAFRPYHPSFCPYGWRFRWNFGTGEAVASASGPKLLSRKCVGLFDPSRTLPHREGRDLSPQRWDVSTPTEISQDAK
jgi:hypothetical protein